jgi:hypothetical protein
MNNCLTDLESPDPPQSNEPLPKTYRPTWSAWVSKNPSRLQLKSRGTTKPRGNGRTTATTTTTTTTTPTTTPTCAYAAPTPMLYSYCTLPLHCHYTSTTVHCSTRQCTTVHDSTLQCTRLNETERGDLRRETNTPAFVAARAGALLACQGRARNFSTSPASSGWETQKNSWVSPPPSRRPPGLSRLQKLLKRPKTRAFPPPPAAACAFALRIFCAVGGLWAVETASGKADNGRRRPVKRRKAA